MIGNLSHTNLQETEFACLTTSYQPTTRVILRTHSFSFAYKDPKNKARDNITLLAIYICRGKTYWLSPHFWSTRHYITRNPRRPRPQHQSGCPVPRQEITAKWLGSFFQMSLRLLLLLSSSSASCGLPISVQCPVSLAKQKVCQTGDILECGGKFFQVATKVWASMLHHDKITSRPKCCLDNEQTLTLMMASSALLHLIISWRARALIIYSATKPPRMD